jgi:hypothetical protein
MNHAVDQEADQRRGKHADDDRDKGATAAGGHARQGIAATRCADVRLPRPLLRLSTPPVRDFRSS